jgi:hypothetical protein
MKISLGQLEFIHWQLREIALWVEQEFGEQRVTSIFRIGDPGVHGQLPVRGLDLGDDYGEEVSQAICNAVNDRWVYDFKRPAVDCALYHKNRTNDGRHIHLQVHPRTMRANNL